MTFREIQKRERGKVAGMTAACKIEIPAPRG